MFAETLAYDWDAHVHSPAFDKECIAQSKRISPSSDSSERFQLWQDDDPSGINSNESSHGISKIEKYLYYFGLRGQRKLGPKLISGHLRIYSHRLLGQSMILALYSFLLSTATLSWARTIFGQLSARKWDERNTDGSRTTRTSNVTIWTGVLPDTTTGSAAFESSRDHIVNQYPSSSPVVPIFWRLLHPLKDVIDRVTTTLGLPISGLKTQDLDGTLGFCFRVGDDLYGVMARHMLFPVNQDNSSYTYIAGPKKEVILMSQNAFEKFSAFMKATIGNLINTISALNKRVGSLNTKLKDGNVRVAKDLANTKDDINNKQETIEALKAFFVMMQQDWLDLNNRIIGHVVWAPPITGNCSPHSYTKDVCVIKLDKKKFWQNFMGNLIDLGTEIDPGKFMSSMCPRDDAQFEFDYPEDRLFRLKGILTAAQMSQSNNRDSKDHPVRFVIKRGHTTLTTIGRLTGFESHQRRYGATGTFYDSVEAAVYPYDNDYGPFSRGGDSGALVVGPEAEFNALLTGGTGPTDSSDISFCTPMYWIWEDVIKPQFPGASLYFDSPPN